MTNITSRPGAFGRGPDVRPHVASLAEEVEAIGCYQQRIALEQDKDAKAIMEDAQAEEFKHFGMDLEFLLRKTPKWRATLEKILFTDEDIVAAGEQGEKPKKSNSPPRKPDRSRAYAGSVI